MPGCRQWWRVQIRLCCRRRFAAALLRSLRCCLRRLRRQCCTQQWEARAKTPGQWLLLQRICVERGEKRQVLSRWPFCLLDKDVWVPIVSKPFDERVMVCGKRGVWWFSCVPSVAHG